MILAPPPVISPEKLIPIGVYTVGDKTFTSKIDALRCSDATGIHPEWSYYDKEFSEFNWQVEPPENLEYYYSLRCKQIRDKYDYIVLHYSGGGDSHNILVHFWKNRIHIDEIIVALPIRYFETLLPNASTATKDLQNEWFFTVKPDLKWISENLPKTRVTIYDCTDDMLNFKVDQDWILHAGEHINPNISNRIQRYYKLNTMNVYDRYTVGHVYGLDKPLVFKNGDEWNTSFLDSVISVQASFKSVFDHHTHINVEYFYWTPDLPEMLIKQVHSVKNYYEANPQFLHLASHQKKTPEDKEKERNLVRRAVYPYWREGIFQTVKASNSFFKEFDQWFFDLASDSAIARWYEGYDYLLQGIDKKWFRVDDNGNPSGLVGFWSKWHKIG